MKRCYIKVTGQRFLKVSRFASWSSLCFAILQQPVDETKPVIFCPWQVWDNAMCREILCFAFTLWLVKSSSGQKPDTEGTSDSLLTICLLSLSFFLFMVSPAGVVRYRKKVRESKVLSRMAQVRQDSLTDSAADRKNLSLLLKNSFQQTSSTTLLSSPMKTEKVNYNYMWVLASPPFPHCRRGEYWTTCGSSELAFCAVRCSLCEVSSKCLRL